MGRIGTLHKQPTESCVSDAIVRLKLFDREANSGLVDIEKDVAVAIHDFDTVTRYSDDDAFEEFFSRDGQDLLALFRIEIRELIGSREWI